MAWTYIMTNRWRTTLYIGATENLIIRVAQHKDGKISGFSKRYNTCCLVYAEEWENIELARAREKRGATGFLQNENRSFNFSSWVRRLGWVQPSSVVSLLDRGDRMIDLRSKSEIERGRPFTSFRVAAVMQNRCGPRALQFCDSD